MVFVPTSKGFFELMATDPTTVMKQMLSLPLTLVGHSQCLFSSLSHVIREMW